MRILTSFIRSLAAGIHYQPCVIRYYYRPTNPWHHYS